MVYKCSLHEYQRVFQCVEKK